MSKTLEENKQDTLAIDSVETEAVKAPSKKKDESVTISRAKLEAVLDRLDRLEAAASKAALGKYDERNREDLGKTIRARTFDGKIVVREVMTKNIVEKSPTGVWREEQELEITFLDGTSVRIPYVYYIRNYKHIPCRCVSETKNLTFKDVEEYGQFMFKLATEDGETIEIGSNYVN